jgi:DNA adenine methylase
MSKEIVKTPLSKYYGGKFNMIKFLLQFVPPHKVYVEVFGGSGALLFAKEPSKLEVFNDIDSEVVNFFRILRDKRKFKEFYRQVSLVPYSREEFKNFLKTLGEGNEVERAVKFFVCVKQSFGGQLQNTGWSYGKTTNKDVSAYLSAIENLPQVVERLRRVQIENRDYRKIFEIYDSEDTFFYCDPPYVKDVRKSYYNYRYEFTLEDHKEFVERVLKLKGMVLISGYEHPIYERLEKEGWKKSYYFRRASASLKSRPVVKEVVWWNQNLEEKLKRKKRMPTLYE